MSEFDKMLEVIADALDAAPHPALIYAARHMMMEYDRIIIPDWIAALAGGNYETWDDLLDVVKAEMEAE